ncbi:MAG: hypothetical protein KF686_03960 [Ramlibacter sp.]|nr:hypothetical protein [Ramlibacter sp.]
MMVDALYEDPQHFAYTVLLDDGRKITVKNKTEVPVGACLSLWLKSDPQSEEGYYPLKFNDIEPSTGCGANRPAGVPANAN